VNRLFCCTLAPVVLWSQSTGGTTGVAVLTPTRAVLAIDSRITLTSGDVVQRGSDECKLRPAGNFYVALAGLNDHAATNFDAWRSIRDAAAGALTVADAAASVELRLAPELRIVLRNIQAADLGAFSRRFAQAHVAVVIAGIERGQPVMAVRAFIPDPNGDLRILRPSGSVIVFGEHDAIDAAYRDVPALVRAVGPAQAARQLVQWEIDRNPARVGPPITILELTRYGATWVQPGLCH
jgi:hypothetical protein